MYAIVPLNIKVYVTEQVVKSVSQIIQTSQGINRMCLTACILVVHLGTGKNVWLPKWRDFLDDVMSQSELTTFLFSCPATPYISFSRELLFVNQVYAAKI